MAFQIKNHRFVGVDQKTTPNMSPGTISPTLIVVHDTAGSSFDGSLSWMMQSKAKAAAHLLIGQDGRIVQLGAFNRKVWHAGASRWDGRQYCNGFSVGIEFDNPGILDRGGRAWFGRTFDDAVPFSTEYHGTGAAKPYTEAQLEVGQEAVLAIARHYGITELAAHYEISPGRKYDTTPIFPLEKFRGLVTGRADPAGDDSDTGYDARVRVEGLNLRRWPTNQDNVIRALQADEYLTIIRSGIYANGFPEARWHQVETVEGEKGWIHSAYVTLL
ncbi:N-acetylmuramoyl-L-alanine amidase [Stappia sp. 22II-S9-Z10]|nr:N-acetylmuramoyl-L-alanine amidase [Stappia sp. 22II-S9-Z10]